MIHEPGDLPKFQNNLSEGKNYCYIKNYFSEFVIVGEPFRFTFLFYAKTIFKIDKLMMKNGP
ncbi:hypothetical protein M918_09240 [Clostridium sp. BL8]|nr:hypothetical protein M918_09240 [Clostridium sp. BL8]